MHDVGYHSYTACLRLRALKESYERVERFVNRAYVGLHLCSDPIDIGTKVLVRKDHAVVKFIEHPTTCTLTHDRNRYRARCFEIFSVAVDIRDPVFGYRVTKFD